MDKKTRKLVEVTGAPARQSAPFIWRDIPEYASPLGTGLVTSRSQRKEELKRHGCREVEPSERSEIRRVSDEGRTMQRDITAPFERKNP